jgi:hypothetical protein
MAHCGYEGTAVDDAFAHPLKALWRSLAGPRFSGPMAPDLPVVYEEPPLKAAAPAEVKIPLSEVRASANREGRRVSGA